MSDQDATNQRSPYQTLGATVQGLTLPNTVVDQPVTWGEGPTSLQIVNVVAGTDLIAPNPAKGSLLLVNNTANTKDITVQSAGVTTAVVLAGDEVLLLCDSSRKWVPATANPGGFGSLFSSALAKGLVDTNVANLAAFAVSGAGRDGITYVQGDIVVLGNQTNPFENGPYLVGAVAGTAPLTRPDWWAAGSVIPSGFTFHLSAAGTLYGALEVIAKCAVGTKKVGTDDPVLRFRQFQAWVSPGAGTIPLQKGGLAIANHPAAGRSVLAPTCCIDFTKCTFAFSDANGGGGTAVTFDIVRTSATAIEVQIYQAGLAADVQYYIQGTDNT